MKKVAKTRIVRIGNARGIRLPAKWAAQLRVGDEVEILVRGSELIVLPAGYGPRQGWEKALRAAAEKGDDPLFTDDLLLDEWPPTKWDMTEWEW
jgi:antitoxin MazE